MAPGGGRAYEPELDEQLGRLWLAARTRVLTDLHRGRHYSLRMGTKPIGI